MDSATVAAEFVGRVESVNERYKTQVAITIFSERTKTVDDTLR